MLPSNEYPDPKEKPVAPRRHRLRSGNLRCIYENGVIRYLSAGSQEIVRSVYAAVRDSYWQTASVSVSGETVAESENGFRINFEMKFSLNDIRYNARVEITCPDENSLSVKFTGIAGSDFLRNRIGLCTLIPPELVRGKPCLVVHPQGNSETISFPENISPVQPFVDIRSLEWKTESGVLVMMKCLGDIFEMEDQRNWGDASYKVYSTPHHLPFPVAVRKGDLVQQEIRFSFKGIRPAVGSELAVSGPVAFHPGGSSLPFPGLGFSYNPDAQTPDAETIKLLRRLAMDHYRIELFFPGKWKDVWERGSATAKQLLVPIHIVIYACDGDAAAALETFLAEAGEHTALVATILLFTGTESVSTTAISKELAMKTRTRFPHIRIGAGTDGYFSVWNQQPVIPGQPGAFISFPVNPQVHQTDTLTMIENLPALTDIIETTRFHSPQTALFVGPVTLKARYNPDVVAPNNIAARFPYAIDPRQQTLFAAAWTMAAIRYLCRADKITLFEITGERGLMPAVSADEGLARMRVFPVYILLREIAAFKPVSILPGRSLSPTEVDGLVLENIHGDRLMIFCNFTSTRQTLKLKTDTWKVLPLYLKIISPEGLSELLEDGEKFRSSPYTPFSLSEGNNCRLPSENILFLTSLRDWSFS